MMTQLETNFDFSLTPQRAERPRSFWDLRRRSSYGRRFSHARVVGFIIALAGLGVPANVGMAAYAVEPETPADPEEETPKAQKDEKAQETKEEVAKPDTPKKRGSPRKPSGKRTPPKPSDKKPKAQESTDDPNKGVEMPADVQRQLDELFERGLPKRSADSEDPAQAENSKRTPRRPRSGRSSPKRPGADSPRGGKSGAPADTSTQKDAPAGPTTKLDLPPSQEAVPARQRTYSFSIKNGTYEQLLQGINRQTGQAILGDAPKDGKVTFVTDEVLTYTEMLSRVRMLLFNYKPHDPYWLREHDTHLKVVRVTDLYRELGLDRMFRSAEDFRAANLPGEELALVIYTPKSGSVARLNKLRDFLPDYVRIAPLEGRNAVTIFALVRDIEKYMELKGIFVDGDGGQDPRTLEVIPVEHIKPSEAWVKIQSLIDLGGASKPRPKSSGRRGRETSVLDAMPEPTVSVVPEDLQGVLIVRAMQDKIDEIKLLLPYVDVDTVETFEPIIIELEYTTADALIPMVEQILTAAPSRAKPTTGAKRSSRSKKGRKKKRATPSTSGAVVSKKITLIPHPTGDAIIVLASAQDVERVRDIVSIFDVKTGIGPIRIELDYIDPDELIATLTQLMLMAGDGGKSADSFQVVRDPAGQAIWFSGTEEELEQVRTIIAAVDIPEGGVTLHVIRLENRTPSFVAGLLSQYDKSGTAPTSSGSKKKGSKKRKGKSSRSRSGQGSTGKFTPDDDEKRLFVLCTEEEWESYLPIIAQLESEIEPVGPTFTLIPVEHITPPEAVRRLKDLFVAVGEKKRGTGVNSVRFEAADGAVMVVNATSDELEQMRELLVVFDRPVEIVRQVFEIHFADPNDIISAIEALIIHTKSGKAASRRGGKPAAKSQRAKATGTPEVTLLPIGSRLFVRATREKMDAIAELIEEFDVEEERTTLRVYEDFAGGADIGQIADTLTELMVGPKTASKKRPKGEAQQQRAKFQAIPQPEVGRLIVVAQPAQFEEIEELLDILRVDIGVLAIETVFVDVQFAEPEEIVQFVDPLLQMKIQELLSSGKLNNRSRPPITLGKAPRKGGKRGTGAAARTASAMAVSWYHLEADARNSRVVIAAPQIVVEEAKRLIAQFDVSPPIDVPTVETALVEVHFADPEDIIELIQPLLSLKVRELVERGELKGAVELPARPAGRKKAGSKKAGQKKPAAGRRAAGRTDEWFHLAADTLNHRIVIAAPQIVVDIAKELIALFDFQADSDVERIETALVDVHFADPDDIIELVHPLLSMKVQELVDRGVLKGDAAVPSKPKQPKKGRRKGAAGAKGAGRSDGWFHLAADSWNRRIVIAAPQVVIDVATELVGKFDSRASQNEPIVKTIELQNSTATDMVKAIREMMGKPSRAGGAKGKSGGKSAGGLVTPEFSIVAAPGNRAVMLRASAELVEQAADWVTQLDSLPGGARKIKVYELQHADPAQLVDLIMATVGTPVSKPGKKGARGRTRVAPVADEEDLWVTKIKRSAPNLYVEADLIAKRMIVAAPPAKLAEVDAIVAQFDTGEEGMSWDVPRVPKFLYELKYKDPFDAELEAQAVFEMMWEPSDEIPRAESAMWGDYLVVEYPHEDRFPEIEEMIRKYVDKPPEGAGEPMRKALAIPEGMSPQDFALWLRMNNPQIAFELVDISERSEADFPIERVGPPRETANPCVYPTAFERMCRYVPMAAVGLGEEAGEGDPPPREENAGAGKDPLRDAARALLGDAERSEATSDEPDAPDQASVTPRETVKIYVDPERGVVIEGRLELVEDVEDSIDDLKEEMETLRAPLDIRIYRVKYIDVFTATEIINEMFNATRQQRQQIQQQQRRAQQQARQQQQQQRRQQKQQQAKAGQAGQQPQRGQRGQPQQANAPQLPPTQVRVYPNPRDRTLILRADSSQYPALLELLSTIDQPQPIESKFRTYTLKKLNAVEVEEVLKDMLGLTAARSGTRRATTNRQGGRTGATRSGGRSTGQSGGQLPQAIMQTKADGTVGELGVDPKDIKISSNEEANTILVMAPEAALDYIGDLIEQLESQNVPDREWKTYELKYADADGVVEYLNSYYGEEGSSSKKKKRGGSSRNMGSGLRSKALNAPSFIAYPRLDLLSAQATAEQFEEIDALIEKVDVRSEEEEWQTVTLARADAGIVADTLTQMFGGGTQQRKGRRGKPSASGGTGPKFIGEEGGRIVHFAAPNNMREDILAVIERIEVETERKTKPRIIQLDRATPSKVAEVIESAFAGQSTGRRGGGRQRGGGSSSARFTLTPHDGTKRLFVIADDATFTEIETLAKLLDVEPEMGVEFKIYPLQFADAKKIHEQMKQLMADYVRMLGRDGGNLPPFSVNVDEKANALIVLGDQAVFSFVEKNLAGVDIAANQRDLPDMLMVKLENAKAQEVAQTINRLWSAKSLPAGELPPVAEGNVALNTLIVRGTESQIEEIRTEFIEPLEENAGPSLLTETFTLQYAQPDTVADLINLIYDDKATAIKALGRESNVPPMEYTVAATPDTTTRQVIVQASEANMEQIRKRIAELDTEENVGGIVRVITLKFGDATETHKALQEALKKPGGRGGRGGQELAGNIRISALAQSNAIVITGSKKEVERIEQQIAEIDEAGKERAIPQMIVMEHAKVAQVLPTVLEMFSEQSRGRGRSGTEPPVITANEAMNVLLVRASPTDFSAIEAVVRNLDTEKLGELDNFRIIQITQGVNITDLAEMVEQAVNDSAEKQYEQVSGGGRGGRGGGRSAMRSVIVKPDPRTSSLIVSGSPELFDYVEKLAKAMEEMGPPQGRGTRIIKVSNRPVDDIMRVIDQLTQREASSQRSGRTGRGRSGSSARSGRSGRSGGRSSPGRRPSSNRGGSRRPSGQRGR